MAALHGLVAKVRTPCAAALRASRRSSSSLPKGDLENALLLKNKIESAEAKHLLSGGDLIGEHCDQTEEIIGQVSERHAKVSRGMRSLTLRYFYTGVVIAFVRHSMESYYYYNKAEFELAELELEDRQRQAGPE